MLAADPHIEFYAGRRYEELHSHRPFRRLPQYAVVWIVSAYFKVARDEYAQTVARHIPFRAAISPQSFDHGLQKAADRLFHKPLARVTDEELDRLMRFSVRPAKYPLATTTAVEP